MIKIFYKNLNKTAFWICLFFSIGLFVASFVTPPMWVITPSVFEAVAFIFGFATLGTVMEAIDKGIDAKLTHGNTELTLNNPDSKKPEE